MRKWIDLINESNSSSDQRMAEQLEGYLQLNLSRREGRNRDFIACVVSDVGHNLPQVISELITDAGLTPKVVDIGHSCVGKELPQMFSPDVVTIVNINPHNLQMCLGKDLPKFYYQLLHVDDVGGHAILIVGKDTQLPAQVIDRYPIFKVGSAYVGGAGDLEDGNIHRII